MDAEHGLPKVEGNTFAARLYRLATPSYPRLSRSKPHKILPQGELQPRKVRSYVERRDPEFELKMGAVLHFDKEVEVIHQRLV